MIYGNWSLKPEVTKSLNFFLLLILIGLWGQWEGKDYDVTRETMGLYMKHIQQNIHWVKWSVFDIYLRDKFIDYNAIDTSCKLKHWIWTCVKW